MENVSDDTPVVETLGPCGKKYRFKADYAEAWVQCPNCTKVYQVPKSADVSKMNALERFIHKRGIQQEKENETIQSKHSWQLRYEMNQIDFMGSETYEFKEEGKDQILAVADRKNYFINAFYMAAIAWAIMTYFFLANTLIRNDLIYWIFASFGTIALLVWSVAILCRFKFVKRDTIFFENEDFHRSLFRIVDESRIEFPKALFTILDEDGKKIGFLEKPWKNDLFRTQWKVLDATGMELFYVTEDSAILGLMRRFFFSKLFWFRINFVLKVPGTDKTIGEFKRLWRLTDRYLLDLSFNSKPIDLRIFMALAVLLDSVERR